MNQKQIIFALIENEFEEYQDDALLCDIAFFAFKLMRKVTPYSSDDLDKNRLLLNSLLEAYESMTYPFACNDPDHCSPYGIDETLSEMIEVKLKESKDYVDLTEQTK